MALRDLLNDLASGGAAALRGIGESATLGLSRYPAALIYSKTMGVPYEEALASVRAQEEQLKREQPLQYGAGKIAGTIATAPITAGTALVPAIARGAVQGGVTGFTEKAGMENVARDVGLGATLGGVLSGVGAGASQLGERFIKNAAINRIDDFMNEKSSVVRSAVKELKPELKQISPKLADEAQRRSALEVVAQNKAGRYAPEDQQLAINALESADKLTGAANLKSLLEPLTGEGLRKTVRGQLEYSATEAIKDAAKLGLQTGIGAGGGYAGGYGLGVLGNLTGMTQMTPQQMADYGFMFGGGAPIAAQVLRAKQATAAALAAKVPTYAGETAGRMLTPVGVPAAISVGRPMPEPSGQLPGTAPVVDELEQLFEQGRSAAPAPTAPPPQKAPVNDLDALFEAGRNR